MKAVEKAAKDDNLRSALEMEPFTEIKEKPTAVIGRLGSDDPEEK